MAHRNEASNIPRRYCYFHAQLQECVGCAGSVFDVVIRWAGFARYSCITTVQDSQVAAGVPRARRILVKYCMDVCSVLAHEPILSQLRVVHRPQVAGVLVAGIDMYCIHMPCIAVF